MENKNFIEPRLKVIEDDARNREIPIIRQATANFLLTQLQIKQPKRILEIGTGVGFSALLMALNLDETTEIVTIEIDEKMAKEAAQNFANFGMDDKISLKIGDAIDILSYLRRDFDFVFMDAAKGQYVYYLDYVLDLLLPGGVIFADNVLFRGKVLSEQKVKHSIRTIVKNLRKYISKVKNNPELISVVLAIDDGVALSVRRKKDET